MFPLYSSNAVTGTPRALACFVRRREGGVGFKVPLERGEITPG